MNSDLTEITCIRNQNIFKFIFHQDKLICACLDYSIKIFSLLDYKLITVLKGHTYQIHDMLIYKNKLITHALSENTVMIWSLDTYELLEGNQFCACHQWQLNCMLVYQNKLIYLDEDYSTIKIGNLDTYLIDKSIVTKKKQYSLLIHKNKLITCSWFNITIWCLQTLQLLFSLEINCSGVLLYQDKLIIKYYGDTYQEIKVFCLKDYKMLENISLELNYSEIYKMIICGDKLFIPCDNKIILIWCLKTYQLINKLEEYHSFNIIPTIVYDKKISITVYGNKIFSTFVLLSSVVWSLDGKKLYTLSISGFEILLSRGLFFILDSKYNLHIHNYEPYRRDYQYFREKLSSIMNKPRIIFRGKIYRGRFYIREMKLLEIEHNKFNNSVN